MCHGKLFCSLQVKLLEEGLEAAWGQIGTLENLCVKPEGWWLSHLQVLLEENKLFVDKKSQFKKHLFID